MSEEPISGPEAGRIKIDRKAIEERRAGNRIKIDKKTIKRRKRRARWLNDYTKAGFAGSGTAVLLGIALGYLMSITQSALVITVAFVLGMLVSLATRHLVKGGNYQVTYLIPGAATLLGLLIAEITYALGLGLSLEYHLFLLQSEMLELKLTELLLGQVGSVVGAKINWGAPALPPPEPRRTQTPDFSIPLGERSIFRPPSRSETVDVEPALPRAEARRTEAPSPSIRLGERPAFTPSASSELAGDVELVTSVEASESGTTIRFGETIEYECPYCQESVHEGHESGMEICPTCRRPHHGDCWAANGNKCSNLH